ncbi:hypothetical protein GCM10009114_34240 [Aliiglaciecola litoralis]|uniref:Uncharacterized protein n=1 Tax=Aliiglaciecola litoralis TaxID=582857 RepID=A0ABN1LS84_9ALTE
MGITILGSISIASHAEESDSVASAIQSCPQQFHSLPLFPDAKMCQVFGQTVPATLTYHAPTDQQSTQQFYTQQLGEAESVKTTHGRIQLEYENANKIIMISKDGAGTQIDVLVKS